MYGTYSRFSVSYEATGLPEILCCIIFVILKLGTGIFGLDKFPELLQTNLLLDRQLEGNESEKPCLVFTEEKLKSIFM